MGMHFQASFRIQSGPIFSKLCLPFAAAIQPSSSLGLTAFLSRGYITIDTSVSGELSQLRGLEYLPIEDVERLERYRPGGYHPIILGDRLHGRYAIVHQLGSGTYSTTWLARDTKLAKYVAIKIATAEGNTQESKILSYLAASDSSDKEHPGKEHVEALGKLPCDWWEEWDARQKWFTEEAKRTSEGTGRSLVDRFVHSIQEPWREEKMEDIEEAERNALLAMFRGLLAFRPNERLTAREIMESEWMIEWGLPTLQGK